MMAGGVVIAAAVGAQHFLLFRSTAAVATANVATAVAAVWVTRSSPRAFAEEIRFHLGLLSAESGTIDREADA
jgi:hypothetical protein